MTIPFHVKPAVRYNLITDTMTHQMIDRVDELVKDGWEPYGPLIHNPENRKFYQPMIKYPKAKT